MRKSQAQPSLASLSEADRDQLAEWLRREEYHSVLARVNRLRPDGFGLTLKSDKPLRTFYAKVALLDVINALPPCGASTTAACSGKNDAFVPNTFSLLKNTFNYPTSNSYRTRSGLFNAQPSTLNS